jgi:hypothetical protein
MRRNIQSYIPGLSHVYYEDKGCKIDRLNRVSEERINENHNFHFNFMMVGATRLGLYLITGCKYDQWNPLNQLTIMRDNISCLVEKCFRR